MNFLFSLYEILSHEIDPFWYQVKTNFRSWDNFRKTLAKIKEEYGKSDDQFIRDFKKDYQNELPPSWIILEITSFGVLSSLYYNLNPGNIKNSIANHFGLNDKTFASWLHSIVYIRNVCAHHSRLWNRVLGIQPLKPRKTKYQWLNNRNIPNNRVYFILSMILYLMNIINPNHTIPAKFKTLLNNYPNIDTKAMGFPEAWEDEPLWK